MAERILWAPQPGPQKALVDCPLPEILFGGARGGGKTDGVLGKWLLKALRYGRGFNGILFRRTIPSADDLWDRASALWGGAGGKLHIQDRAITLPNGARLRLRPLERTADADKYQGQNVSDVGVEEAGQYPDPGPIDRLHGILRSATGVPTQMVLTANPGGAGHAWIKQRYIDPAPAGMTVLRRSLPTGDTHAYVYIPSRVQDNRVLLDADPSYVRRLYLVGSAQLVKAWLEGDWNAIEGAFFSEWDTSRHVVEPFDIPPHWLRFRSMDWGSASPFSVGWWAVASEDCAAVPRGGLVRYREWYGASGINVGLKLHAEDVARGILARELTGEVGYGVLDPAAFAEDGGPSIAERMARLGVRFRPADNKRVGVRGALGGWDMMRARLKGEDGGKPMLVVFETCKDFIRTVPVLQHDPGRPEDLDTGAEDHVADEARYACMSRPWMRPTPVDKGPPRGLGQITFNELLTVHEQEAKKGGRI